MAKKTQSVQSPALVDMDPRAQIYEGTFKGNLEGNADTATQLAKAFTVNFTKDAQGTFSTAGKSTNVGLHVLRSDEAEHAKTADSALNVQLAQTAISADFARNASSADKAVKASTADTAKHATYADEATVSARSTLADKAAEADHSITADTALVAQTADKAIVADTALALANPDNPVKLADHALTAHVAEIARYDCLGRSITDYYALKSDLLPYKDLLTVQQGYSLFVPREEQILAAVVRGRAFGRGVVEGNTLHINIESVAPCWNVGEGGGGCNIYCDILFEDFPGNDADTTKAYVDSVGNMHLWDHGNQTWMTVTAPLDPESEQQLINFKKILEAALAEFKLKLANMVTIDEDQTIKGAKIFERLVETPIAALDVDNPRTVVTVHNLKDVRDSLSKQHHIDYHHLKDLIEELELKVDIQSIGDILMGGKDFTVKANQKEMVPKTIYLNYLDANKNYIPADPETWRPLDPKAEIVYIRSLVKTTTDVVTWWDKRCVIDPDVWVPWHIVDGQKWIKLDNSCRLVSEDINGVDINLIMLDNQDIVQTGSINVGYNINVLNGHVTVNGKDILATSADLENYMPKSGGDFTGAITVPHLHQSVKDRRVFSSAVVHTLIDEKIATFNNDLNLHKYMPKAGGQFLGKITVPDSIDLETAGDEDVLNKKDIETLIGNTAVETGFVRIVFCNATPDCANKMEPNVLYSVPVQSLSRDGDIHRLIMQIDTSTADPANNEGIIFGNRDIL